MLFFRFRIVIQIEIRFFRFESFCLSSAKKFSLITDLITIFFWDSIQLDYAIPSIETEKELKLSVCSIKQSMNQFFADIYFSSKKNFALYGLNRARILIYIARLVCSTFSFGILLGCPLLQPATPARYSSPLPWRAGKNSVADPYSFQIFFWQFVPESAHKICTHRKTIA